MDFIYSFYKFWKRTGVEYYYISLSTMVICSLKKEMASKAKHTKHVLSDPCTEFFFFLIRYINMLSGTNICSNWLQRWWCIDRTTAITAKHNWIFGHLIVLYWVLFPPSIFGDSIFWICTTYKKASTTNHLPHLTLTVLPTLHYAVYDYVSVPWRRDCKYTYHVVDECTKKWLQCSRLWC